MKASDLPDDLDRFLSTAAQVVPAGTGQGHAEATRRSDQWFSIHGMAPGGVSNSKLEKKARVQFGSLGSGNHFFEVCLDETDSVWLVLHSGSRGVGNQLAQQHIKRAKTMAKDLELGLEDIDLAYFTQDQPEFEAYLADMLWAQAYALGNREAMMADVTAAFIHFVAGSHGVARPPVDQLIRTRTNVHHNYTQRELHGGKHLWITRKGAIKAAEGDLGVIPGSMGTRSYIVRGLGNPDSWNSCSHGAGRRMSRSAAKRAFTGDDLREHMDGKVWNEEHADQLVDEQVNGACLNPVRPTTNPRRGRHDLADRSVHGSGACRDVGTWETHGLAFEDRIARRPTRGAPATKYHLRPRSSTWF